MTATTPTIERVATLGETAVLEVRNVLKTGSWVVVDGLQNLVPNDVETLIFNIRANDSNDPILNLGLVSLRAEIGALRYADGTVKKTVVFGLRHHHY